MTSTATPLTTCRTRTLVAFHPAYGYLARRYDLHQVSLMGLGGVTPARMEQVARLIRDEHVRAVYREPQYESRWIEAISRQTGDKVLVLDPIGQPNRPGYDSYFSMMPQQPRCPEGGPGLWFLNQTRTSTTPHGKPYVGHDRIGDEAICVRNLTYVYPDGTAALPQCEPSCSGRQQPGCDRAQRGWQDDAAEDSARPPDGVSGKCNGSRHDAGGDSPGRRSSRLRAAKRATVDWNFPIRVRDAIRLGLTGKTPRPGTLPARRPSVLRRVPPAERAGDLASGRPTHWCVVRRPAATRCRSAGRSTAPAGTFCCSTSRLSESTSPRSRCFTCSSTRLQQEFGLTLVIVSHDLAPLCSPVASGSPV